jgi:hypothetical protein
MARATSSAEFASPSTQSTPCPVACVEREGDELVVGHKERETCAPDDTGRAKDRDLHMPALDAGSSK